MDITSLYYFTEVAKDLHITKTANRLYISQQTLSNHIQRLEEHFGTQLLNRKPRLSLTYAGEFVLSFANVVMKEQTNLHDILSDVERNERGIIRFGASSMRMDSLAFILPTFTARYPNVEMRLTSLISNRLEPMVADGELDFAIVTSEKSSNDLLQENLMQDQIYLCVADPLLKKYYGDQAEDIKKRSIEGASVADFSKLPFCIFSNNMGQQIHECFVEAGFTPITRMNTDYMQISTTIGFQGLAAFFASHVNLSSRAAELPKNMNVFPLLCHGEPMHLNISLLRHRQRYLPHYAKYFLELLFDYCAATEQAPIPQLAPAEK